MKRKLSGIARKARGLAVLGLAGCLLYSGSGQASATVLKDVFDEKYYADSYKDLKEEYGYDRELLWEHFMAYGLSEGRNMNPFIDIAKYRASYADLDEAFGDDWDAYLRHYLTFGAKEKRDTGTDFNALDYAERYADLKEEFGDDIFALWNHYKTAGSEEKREARSETVVVAEKKAKEEAERRAQEAAARRTEKYPNSDGSWVIREYDSADREVKVTYYDADGSVWYSYAIEYNGAGKVEKRIWYDADGSVWGWTIYEYNDAGYESKQTSYDADGNVTGWGIDEYDDAGNLVKYTWFNADNSVSEWIKYEYSTENYVITWYDAQNKMTRKQVERHDADGYWRGTTSYTFDDAERVTREEEYGIDGSVKNTTYEYNADGSYTKSEYGADGELIRQTKYDKDGNEIKPASDQKPSVSDGDASVSKGNAAEG